MKTILTILTFLSLDAFAGQPLRSACLPGSYNLIQGTVSVCRADYAWYPPSTQEWVSYVDQFGEDAGFIEAVRAGTGVSVAEFKTYLDKRVAEDKTVVLTADSGSDTTAAKKIVDYLNTRAGLLDQLQKANAKPLTIDDLNDGPMAYVTELAEIAKINSAHVAKFVDRGCAASVAADEAAKDDKKLRMVELDFYDKGTGKILLLSVEKKDGYYVIHFFGNPPMFPTGVEQTRTINANHPDDLEFGGAPSGKLFKLGKIFKMSGVKSRSLDTIPGFCVVADEAKSWVKSDAFVPPEDPAAAAAQ